MSEDDDLRRRLRDVDPARPGGPRSSQQSPTAHDILERAMRTADQHDSGTTSTGTTTTPTTTPTTTSTTTAITTSTSAAAGAGDRRGRRTHPVLVAGLAAVAAVVAGGGLVLSGAVGGNETPSPATTLALTAAPADASSSCLVFDVAVLAQAPTALAGTVSAVEGSTVTVEVDRWYRGGPAEVVTVSSDQRGLALGGIELVAGEDYLLTASEDGTVNGCGYSGPATPELRAAFEEAFGG